jgi:dTDP-glucose 4,6-dehydratase
MNILVTGGAGFIGSNFLNLLVPAHPEHLFINVDKLSYAANPKNLAALEPRSNYRLEVLDLADGAAVHALFAEYRPELIVHFAAESHVDRSIHGPHAFIHTNIVGTFNLLEAARHHWDTDSTRSSARFHHVSTDEVYGSLGPTGRFTETSRYDPSNPYSASKAASDHLVRAYARTYRLPVTLSHASNNYGPYQFPEKLIPLMILNALASEPLPIYGRGENVRDWLYVTDHCRAIWAIVQHGTVGEIYNVGGESELRNIDVVNAICRIVAEETGRDLDSLLELRRFVADRPGHDLRYAMDASKLRSMCGWAPEESFETGLRKTVQWYLHHPEWVAEVQSGAYRCWLARHYVQPSTIEETP